MGRFGVVPFLACLYESTARGIAVKSVLASALLKMVKVLVKSFYKPVSPEPLDRSS